MMHIKPKHLEGAARLDVLQWYAVRMVAPTNGHRRSAMLGGDRRDVRTRSGHVVKRRKPGTGDRVFVPEHILKKAGFSVFLPVKKRWRKRHRFTSEQELVSFPLVADWMFVGWPEGQARWHELTSLRVISGVMGSGGKPVRVCSKVVARLMKRWGDGVLPAVRREAERVAAGDTVSVTAGPFVDFDGLVIDVEGEGARVAINLFGRETPVALLFDEMAVVNRSEGAAATGVALVGELSSGAPACLRCGCEMVAAHDEQKKHHLKCCECDARGALFSSSKERALAVWKERVRRL
ncbi:hypothetical protein HKX54_02295 [Sulfitobacter sp. M57]|uniref:transcription termination/antitermination protein NusG n=1 Tax=unclassified Sulfitobacter TaxID=196795 RepID=UPI0023E0F3D5|nr:MULTISPECIES: transcription termination/antitermination NusG family protein [unclassified Sulfitobacter]MDF3413272.1 hypothetical protein [Sulfitobacter sp. KE5]MDF3421447.1 hypothetical protein [Sulfitobacter sp. KE43]MDF3431819.1 hypothetical protein [Sulfitobacter sp. KE42]MDF3457459.1 hypothetical protein [Sulfitobacter sp. S74]MDF3461362.1 hypothetical protein [Sulfitobacter sp. Ks18]